MVIPNRPDFRSRFDTSGVDIARAEREGMLRDKALDTYSPTGRALARSYTQYDLDSEKRKREIPLVVRVPPIEPCSCGYRFCTGGHYVS